MERQRPPASLCQDTYSCDGSSLSWLALSRISSRSFLLLQKSDSDFFLLIVVAVYAPSAFLCSPHTACAGSTPLVSCAYIFKWNLDWYACTVRRLGLKPCRGCHGNRLVNCNSTHVCFHSDPLLFSHSDPHLDPVHFHFLLSTFQNSFVMSSRNQWMHRPRHTHTYRRIYTH